MVMMELRKTDPEFYERFDAFAFDEVANDETAKLPMETRYLAILAALIVLFGLTLCDNVFPRVRWERMLAFTWGTTLVAGGGNMLILMLLDK